MRTVLIITLVYSIHDPTEEDIIFTGPSTDGLIQSNSGEHLMLNITRDNEGQGYIGTFNVVVNANQTG
jgi:hypothetical protein